MADRITMLNTVCWFPNASANNAKLFAHNWVLGLVESFNSIVATAQPMVTAKKLTARMKTALSPACHAFQLIAATKAKAATNTFAIASFGVVKNGEVRRLLRIKLT